MILSAWNSGQSGNDEYPGGVRIAQRSDIFTLDGRVHKAFDAPIESTAELWRKDVSIVNEATWSIAYGIDAVQDWLFAQRRR